MVKSGVSNSFALSAVGSPLARITFKTRHVFFQSPIMRLALFEMNESTLKVCKIQFAQFS